MPDNKTTCKSSDEDDLTTSVNPDTMCVVMTFTKKGASQPKLIVNMDAYDLDAVIGSLTQCRDNLRQIAIHGADDE